LFQILDEIVLMPSSKLEEMGIRGKELILKNRSWDVIALNYIDSISKI
jgi:hypothetical protein